MFLTGVYKGTSIVFISLLLFEIIIYMDKPFIISTQYSIKKITVNFDLIVTVIL